MLLLREVQRRVRPATSPASRATVAAVPIRAEELHMSVRLPRRVKERRRRVRERCRVGDGRPAREGRGEGGARSDERGRAGMLLLLLLLVQKLLLLLEIPRVRSSAELICAR